MFPSGAPPGFAALAADCWAAAPEARPRFPEVCARLQALADAPAAAGGGGEAAA